MKKLVVILFFVAAVFSCQREDLEKVADESTFSIEQAKALFGSNWTGELSLKSANDATSKLGIKPDWERGTASQNDEFEVVEVELIIQGQFGFANNESYNEWKLTKDQRMVSTLTRMVFLKNKKTGKISQFLMSIVGNKKYHLDNEGKLGNNTYLKREQNFSGYIMYHDLTGKYVNGWVYKNGKIKGTLSKKAGEDLKTELKMAVTCFTYTITTYYEQCTDWFRDWNGDGKLTWDEYTNTTCKTYSVTSDYTECLPYFTGSGGGYIPPVEQPHPCTCTKTCPDCGGCLDEALLKSANAACPACSCPKVIIDPSFENTKADCVYNKLINSSLLKDLQSAFKLNEKYDLIYKVVQNLTPVYSDQPTGNQRYDKSTNTSVININAYYFDKQVPVSIANTILHETIHSMIAQKIDRVGGLNGLDVNDFEGVIKSYYNTYEIPIISDHSIISEYYIPNIAKTLQSFDNNRFSIKYYQALAWHGLWETWGWYNKTDAQEAEIRAMWDDINEGLKKCE